MSPDNTADGAANGAAGHHAGGDWSISALLTGKVARFGPDGEGSAIGKTRCDAPQMLDWFGFVADEQADKAVHGGPDKAVHHYPADHYPWWQQTLGDHPLLADAGAFGENIATGGLVEDAACIGDRFRMGTALVEISQGRQPCWKLGHRFGHARVPALVVSSRRSGWYYRVIETGIVAPGDGLALIDRPFPQWSVARAFALLIGGGARHDRAATAELAALPPLAQSWAKRAVQLSTAA
ncbi:MAG: MOSC domain-containing protein [Sphingopyxis sp.]